MSRRRFAESLKYAFLRSPLPSVSELTDEFLRRADSGSILTTRGGVSLTWFDREPQKVEAFGDTANAKDRLRIQSEALASALRRIGNG